MLQSRQGRVALCDVIEQAEQIDVAEQPSVMVQNRQGRVALCDVVEQPSVMLQSRAALYIIIKMLCQNDYVCLMRFDSFDKLVSYVRDDTLTYAYTCNIAKQSLEFDMTPGYQVIYEYD